MQYWQWALAFDSIGWTLTRDEMLHDGRGVLVTHRATHPHVILPLTASHLIDIEALKAGLVDHGDSSLPEALEMAARAVNEPVPEIPDRQ